ncbi:Uncharacterised protein [Rhodococcus gordoniae]|uniref:Uncharacterized protein n=1 Tax=Rhodococcus gordoniae TaxID=223392 RepID=A0A379M2M8_9NOCA|nr:Uncharacterised protein [Rhodococcus gordoniae]
MSTRYVDMFELGAIAAAFIGGATVFGRRLYR